MSPAVAGAGLPIGIMDIDLAVDLSAGTEAGSLCRGGKSSSGSGPLRVPGACSP